MADRTVAKVDSGNSLKGLEGQKHLSNGRFLPIRQDYETVGYVIAGRAELVLEEQTMLLHTGVCRVVPKGVEHTDRITEELMAEEGASRPLYKPIKRGPTPGFARRHKLGQSNPAPSDPKS